MAPISLPSTSNFLPRTSELIAHIAHDLSTRIPHVLPSQAHTQTPQIVRRQTGGTAVIPSVYKIDGPQGGAVAGIVLGSVAGFLLIVLLIYFLTNGNANSASFTITGENQEIAAAPRDNGARSSRDNRRSRRSGSRSDRIVETRERSPRVRTTIVEERRRQPSIVSERIMLDSRRGSRGPPPIRRVDGDDIVEVIEEGSSIGPPSPRRDRRSRGSGYGR